MEEAEKIDFIRRRVMRPMAEYTFPYVASIIGVFDSDRGKHACSALRCVLSGRRCIITALHLAKKAKEHSVRIAVTAGYGVRPYELHGEPDLIDDDGDLAAYFVGDDYPDENDRVAFWPEEYIERSDEKRGTDYLFLHGFPGVRSEFVQLSGVHSLSFPYGVMQKDDLTTLVRPFQFAVDFDESNFFKDTGDPSDFVDPHGMSGCPVWRIGVSGRSAQSWLPEHCRLVGIASKWRRAEKILVITASSRVLDMTGALANR